MVGNKIREMIEANIKTITQNIHIITILFLSVITKININYENKSCKFQTIIIENQHIQ